ncbi:DUF2167 domain-containing protein [Caballeronia sp. LZ025]|nr:MULTISPECIES: DUF2167 domain-containing protein [Caballeronia]MDR5734625.1 DUF2167 domain-containing protein [Caballeronia sp. LZ025]
MLFGVVLQWGTATAHAETGSHAGEAEAAWAAARGAAVMGPATIELRDQATLKIGKGQAFIPQPQAGRLMKAQGNGDDPDRVGLVLPTTDEEWVVDAQYVASGYIKDDDAKNWNVDDLFKSLKDSTEAANEDRRERGIAEMEIIGWAERPHYDAAKRQLVWSMSSRSKGDAADAPHGINYNTYALGREGYVSLDLITDEPALAADKKAVQALLGGLEFKSGKRYADFKAGTDKVAEYGLAALVGGIAIKKLGLLAIIGAFLAKSFKLVAIGVAALGVAAKKLFKRKSPAS